MTRMIERSKRLSAGEPLEEEHIISFEDPLDLIEMLTLERMRLLRAARGGPLSVEELAKKLVRPRTAVMRDIKHLEKMGVLTRRRVPNPGHGVKTVVEATSERFDLVASF